MKRRRQLRRQRKKFYRLQRKWVNITVIPAVPLTVCFRCCVSTSHLARDCRTPLKCRECESERHSTAMHPGPVSWTSNPVGQEHTEQESEKEEDLSDSAAINWQCTGVCGTNQSARSCSTICLVKVYKKNQPQHAVSMYAILDDQSNCSLARSEFFDFFDIQTNPHPYSLSTCAGVRGEEVWALIFLHSSNAMKSSTTGQKYQCQR